MRSLLAALPLVPTTHFSVVHLELQWTIYVFADSGIVSLMSGCHTLSIDDLNTSDQVPTVANICLSQLPSNPGANATPRPIDWAQAERDGSIVNYKQNVSKGIAAHIHSSSYECVEDINHELKLVTSLLAQVAEKTLPVKKAESRHRFKDATLSALCAQSSLARRKWIDEGRPMDGPIYEEKCGLRRAVRKRVRYCAAQEENRRIQRRDKLFATNHHQRFRKPKGESNVPRKLCVNGEFVSDPEKLLNTWADHFRSLAKSKCDQCLDLQELHQQMDSLALSSMSNEDHFLDVPFSSEEVEAVLKKLKKRKSPGLDGLLAEHLQYGGIAVVKWLAGLLNAIVVLEEIPEMMKCGVVIPVYKGAGKDPLNPSNYRGITIASVVCKLLESLLLSRLQLVYADANIPHLNQSAYRRNVSCADAIFATQETVSRYISEGSNIFMCLYDLQKAFDSVEYPILLQRLFDVGVNGKCWRLIRSFYKNTTCRVRVGEGLSTSYVLERGVKQGSILSPALFLLVMDPLLSLLENSGVGLSINNLYAGGFVHADDIRTLASSSDSLQKQITMVENFCTQNFLQLNVQKCEIVAFSLSRSGGDIKLPDGVSVPQRKHAKCLGYWWERDLLANCCVEQNNHKSPWLFLSLWLTGGLPGRY